MELELEGVDLTVEEDFTAEGEGEVAGGVEEADVV